MSFNKITVVGNLGADPELRYTPQGVAVCTLSIATNETQKGKDSIVTWFRVTLWRQQAELADKYLRKGSPIYIEGRLSVDTWTDKDQNTRFTLEVSATDMKFIGERGERDEAPLATEETEHRPEPSVPEVASKPRGKNAKDDDIPF